MINDFSEWGLKELTVMGATLALTMLFYLRYFPGSNCFVSDYFWTAMEEMSYFYDDVREVEEEEEELLEELEESDQEESTVERNENFKRLDTLINDINKADKESAVSVKTIAITLRVILVFSILLVLYLCLMRMNLTLTDVTSFFFSREIEVLQGRVEI